MIDYNFKIKPKDKCIILSHHADDESIGCGGLLLKYPQYFKVAVFTDGAKGGNDTRDIVIKTRLEELKN